LTPQGVREMSLRPSVSLSFLLVSLYFFYDVNTVASLAFQHFFLGFIHLSATHFQDSSASFAAINVTSQCRHVEHCSVSTAC
jgi:hypothetical protein